MTVRYRTLAQSLLTGRGTYVLGLEVIQLKTQRRGWARICLDPYGCHFGGRCHAVHVPHSWLQPVAASRTQAAA